MPNKGWSESSFLYLEQLLDEIAEELGELCIGMHGEVTDSDFVRGGLMIEITCPERKVAIKAHLLDPNQKVDDPAFIQRVEAEKAKIVQFLSTGEKPVEKQNHKTVFICEN